MRKLLTKYPLIRGLIKSILRIRLALKLKLKFVRLEPIIIKMQECVDFPASDGSPYQHLNLTLKGNKETIHLLNRLLKVPSLVPIPVKTFKNSSVEEESLLALFDSYGSDKGTRHGYYLIYTQIFKRIAGPMEILEIGIGSNNPRIPSNMGRFASPGASLRALRDFKTGVTVTGADIDNRILLSDLNITCHHLDQTLDSSWIDLSKKVSPKSLDLLIDDGLHSPLANLRTLIYGPKLLKPNGFIVIEDIAENALPVWELAAFLSPEEWKFTLYQCFKTYALLLEIP